MGNKNPKLSYTLRIVAGAYVAYLGIGVARMPFKEETGLPFPVAVGMGVVLAILGVIFVVNGLLGYKYMKEHPEEFEESAEVTEETGASEELQTDQDETASPAVHTAASSSILQKTALPEHLQVHEDEDMEESEKE
ncbi:MAG: hypothetical protein Q4B85_03560 [Lachnospiraceae bacterium]|nr:hypothetical protein [Lachnospiraceae bacterium]